MQLGLKSNYGRVRLKATIRGRGRVTVIVRFSVGVRERVRLKVIVRVMFIYRVGYNIKVQLW